MGPLLFWYMTTMIVVVVQSLSCVRLFVTWWTAARQTSLSFTISRSLFKLMSIEWVMPSSHLVLCPSPPALSLSQHQGLFQWVSSSYQMTKVLELQLQHQFFQWVFRITDWFDLLSAQRTLKSLLQHRSPKALLLQLSAFFMVQPSHSYMTTGKTMGFTYGPLLAK